MDISDEICEKLEKDSYRGHYGNVDARYELGLALVRARKKQNLTQTELATKLGVSQTYISNLERGEANPTIGRIGELLATIWLKLDMQTKPLIEPKWEGLAAHYVNGEAFENEVLDTLGQDSGTAGATAFGKIIYAQGGAST